MALWGKYVGKKEDITSLRLFVILLKFGFEILNKQYKYK
jgi:hypothetical protein